LGPTKIEFLLKEIAANYSLNYGTVKYTWQHREERPQGVSKERGRPRKTSPVTEARIYRAARTDPDQTLEQLRRMQAPQIGRTTLKARLKDLGIKKWPKRLKPFLEARDKAKRLPWALEHEGWTREQWDKVIWSDECSVELGSGRRREWVFRHFGEEWLPQMIGSRPRKGVRVMCWAAFKGDGPIRTVLYFPESDPASKHNGVTARTYLAMLREALPTIYEPGDIFMQDGAPIHRASIVKEWLEYIHMDYSLVC